MAWLMLGMALVGPSAWAATFVVDHTGDDTQSACTGAAGDCSLRGAINAANSAAGADIITIPAGTYTLTINSGNDDDDNTQDDLDIFGSVTFNGAGAGSTIIQAGTTNTNGINRIFDIGPDSALTSYPINVTFTNMTIQNGHAGGGGGAIRFDDGDLNGKTNGSLTITNCSLLNNHSQGRGGAVNAQGGVHQAGFTESISITGTTISGNSTTNGNGGGLDLRNHIFTIDNCTISNNTALAAQAGSPPPTGFGGGINSFQSQPGSVIKHTTISGNSAEWLGGGIFSQGHIALDNTGGAVVISGNKSGSNGGGWYVTNASSPTSDSTYQSSVGTVSAVGATIQGNTADATIVDPTTGTNATTSDNLGDGGGIFFDMAQAAGVTATMSMTNCLIDTNTAFNGGGIGAYQFFTSPGITSGTLTANSNTFTGNNGRNSGGGVLNGLGANTGRTLVMHFNRFTGNKVNNTTHASSSGYNQVSGTSTIDDNWWDTNNNPSNAGCGGDCVNNQSVSPFIVLSQTAGTSPIRVNETSTLTASFLKDSAGSTISFPNGVATDLKPLIGLGVTWNNPVNGTLSNQVNTIQSSGTTTATFTANKTISADSVNGAADSTVDGVTKTTNPAITINRVTTSTTVTSSTANPIIGDSVSFTATIGFPVAPPGGLSDPAGTVTFTDTTTATTLATNVAVSTTGGVTTATITGAVFQIAGNHTISASYTGDSTYKSSSNTLVKAIGKGTVGSVTLTSDKDKLALFTDSVTFTATITKQANVTTLPTGKIKFLDGATDISAGGVTIAAGQAQIAHTFTTAGPHTISAVYLGDTNYNDTTGNPKTFSQLVKDNGTTVGLLSSGDTVFGQQATMTATINLNDNTLRGDTGLRADVGDPTGTVDFFDTTTATALASNVAVSTTGGVSTAVLNISSLAVGAHSVKATYTPTNSYTGSNSTATQNVGQAATTTALNSDVNPSLLNQTVTFTATVTVAAPGVGTPTGKVQFLDNGADISTGGVTLVGDTAQFQTSSLTVGTHPITAHYVGDPSFSASDSSPAIQQLVKDTGTTLVVGTSGSPTVFGQSVTITAVVTPNDATVGTPTGNVTFVDSIDGPLGTVALAPFNGALPTGKAFASVTTSALSVSNGHVITATYTGVAPFTSSSNTVGQVVNPAGTTTTLISDVNPSNLNQTVTFTATVSINAPGTGTLTGNVIFLDNGVDISSGGNAVNPDGLGNFAASFQVSNLTVGTHPITAQFVGETNFNPSTSTPPIQQVIRNPATTVGVVSSVPAGSTFGQSVTFTATVTPADPSLGNPTGTVDFTDSIDGSLGSGTLSTSGGVTTASVTTSALTAAPNHVITATYGNNSPFTGNNGTVNQAVSFASTTTVLKSSFNPSLEHQTVTFTATVSVNAPGVGPATGHVEFQKDGNPLPGGIVAVASDGNGHQVATYQTDFPNIGTFKITADYNSDNNNISPSSAPTPFNQVVNAAPSVTITNPTTLVAAPTTGNTSNAVFTVILTAPVTNQPIKVTYQTADGTAVAGTDYTAVGPTVLTFAANQTTKTVSIPVLVGAGAGKTFTLNLSNTDPSAVGIAVGTGTATITHPINPKDILISEYRLRGTSGAQDEFIEFYNNSESDLTVGTMDGSSGWGFYAINSLNTFQSLFVIPNGTLIPARSHYLVTNSNGYSLSLVAAGDQTYATDIPDDSGIALYRTSKVASVNTVGERLDAVGYSNITSPLFREGAGFPTSGQEIGTNLQYSFFRNLSTGAPKISATPDNLEDFLGVAPTGETLSTTAHPLDPNFPGKRLGVPGPENLSSPIQRNELIQVAKLDSSAAISLSPNREVDYTSTIINGSFYQGTVILRRTITNTSGHDITKLQLRISDLTTFPSPTGTADARAETISDTLSGDPTPVLVNGNPVDVMGTELQMLPGQAVGGAYNSVLTVPGITPGTPLATGASVNIQVLLGLAHLGTGFRFSANFEMLP